MILFWVWLYMLDTIYSKQGSKEPNEYMLFWQIEPTKYELTNGAKVFME